MYPAMVTKKLTWYYVMHSEKLEVIQWYFQIRAELQLISNMFIDKPTWMAVDIQTDNNGRIQSIMPIDTFDYLVHPDRNLIIPTSRFLLAHPEISLNRALTFASFPTTIYDNVSLMFEHFEAVFWSFDRLKLSYFLTLTNQSGLPNQKNNILLREKLAVLGSYGANIPQFAKKWDVEPWMGFVFEKLGITPVLFQYHKISRAWSRLMPSNSDINMNWIVHKLARPFSHKYNTAKVFRFIRKFINNEQGGFLVSPLHYSKYMMRLFHKTVAFYNE